ncbi:MAG: hypothetical protein WC919_06530 [Candidatus Paceibacterota bacterium]|jgi:hypothetical protein
MARILGFVDIFAGLIFTASFYEIDVPRGLMITVGVILILKGVLFLMNIFSWIDLAAGVLLVFGLALFLPSFVPLALAAFLGIKGLISLLTF